MIKTPNWKIDMKSNILCSFLAEEEKQLLLESVTFHAAIIQDDGKRKMYDTAHFQKAEQQECWVCDGTGKDPYHSGECGMCDGKKEVTKYVTPYKSLNVSNSNAQEILNMLDQEMDDEWCGAWEEKELPVIRRKLIAIKNKDSSKYVIPSSDTQGKARAVKDENGQSRISRGPRVIDGGVSSSQINHYVDTLLALIDFAQKNKAVVTWC